AHSPWGGGMRSVLQTQRRDVPGVFGYVLPEPQRGGGRGGGGGGVSVFTGPHCSSSTHTHTHTHTHTQMSTQTYKHTPPNSDYYEDWYLCQEVFQGSTDHMPACVT